MSLPAHPFFSTPEQRSALARERFFGQGMRPLGLVAEPIVQSWHRSLAAGHRPDARPAFDPVSRSRARAAVDRQYALLEAAADEVDRLAALLARTGCRVLLTDRTGIVVRAHGGQGRPDCLLDLAGRIGVDLSEACVGSTAPGISAQSGDAVAVIGAEHFYGALGTLSCAAAPILGASGQCVGVLDVSIENRAFGFDALAQVRQSTAAIENVLLARAARGGLLVRLQGDPRLLGSPMEALAVVDGGGRVTGLNDAAARLFGVARDAARGWSVQALLDASLETLLSLSRRADPQPHRLANGLTVWLQVQLDGRAAPPDDAVGPAPAAAASRDDMPPPAAEPASLEAIDRRAIAAALAACGGNVSAAARRLGVSRGLLYRRLAAAGR